MVALVLVLGINLAESSESTVFRLFGGLAILSLAGLGFYVLGKRVLGSLDDLLSAAQRIAGGDYSLRAPSSDSEIGRLGRYFNVLVDRQKVTVGQVEGSRRKLEDLLGSLPIEIALFDAKGCYLYEKLDASAPYSDSRLALGMTPRELYAMRGQDVQGHEVQEAVEQCIESGEPVTLQQVVVSGDGAREFTRVFTPVDADRSDAVRVVGYALDVSEQRRAEATLREREEQLKRAQRLESVGRLAGGVAEDFDQLLTSILGAVEVGMGVDSVPELARENLEAVKSDTLRAKILVGQLLAFGRKQVLRPEIVDLSVLVREAEMMLRRIMGRHIRVDSTHVDEPLMVDVDPAKIEQVLMRLALNARDAMSDGGRLTIRTDVVELSERPKHATGPFEPGAYAVITVGDTGQGMDAATLLRVFEPFSTPTSGNGERGLGLSAVEGTVSQSGGFLTAESEIGSGTVFRVHLKRVGLGVSAAAKPSSPQPTGEVARRGTALVAIASDLFREFTRRTLERAGFEVLAEKEGGAAIDLARDHERPITLFVVDVSVGGMSAADAVRVVTSFQPDIHVLPVAMSPQGSRDRRAALGRVHYLREPFESDDLVAAVEQAIQGPVAIRSGGNA